MRRELLPPLPVAPLVVLPVVLLGATLALAACKRGPAPESTASSAAPVAMCAPGAAAGTPKTLDDWARGAQLFDGLGDFHRAATGNVEAQRYFDQGMRLLWGFNHDEATRAFAKAGQLDPACAICWWGAALVLGPNYNVPMLPDRAQAAWDALQKARATAAHATPVDRALIEALGSRYAGPEPLDGAAMAPQQVAFAKAMGDVAKRYPADLDVQTLYAEALMTANPWKLWDATTGMPSPGTPEIVAVLEAVLAKAPRHPGANHYYIHAVEASRTPEQAIAAAERLGPLTTAAGHLLHMPAHIFQRVGRYEDAAKANRAGVAADLAYLAKTPPPGYYPMYLSHNYAFLAYAASMEGRSAEALQAAREAQRATPQALVDQMPGADFAIALHYPVMVRFGRWDAILAEAAPDPKYPILTGLHRYAHAYALAATGKADAAEAERVAAAVGNAKLPADLSAGLNPARDVLAIADAVLRGRIAQARGDLPAAIAALREAVRLEDALAYDEPADWFFPARHLLGAVLLANGQSAEAETVYRDDLARHPANGWALRGLQQAQAARGQTGQAAATEALVRVAWSKADIELTASAF